MSERRQDQRRHRKRLPVRFWKRGEDKTRSGFTTNISVGGMFIGSNQVLSRGTRLRIEVVDPRNGFIVEGVVARAERSRPELRSVRSSGMGVRFLPVQELVSELFPKAEQLTTTEEDAFDTESPQPVPASESAPAKAPASASPTSTEPMSTEPASTAPTSADPGSTASGEAGTTPAPPRSTRPARQMRGFAVSYASLDDLRRTYEKDIRNGGLFVSTQKPAGRGEVVMIEIRPPAEAGSPFRLRARVVHTFEPSAQGDGQEANLLAGMGVEWLDPEAAQKSFEYYLDAPSSASA